MHDHNTYDGVVHRQEERYSRKKHNLVHSDPHDPSLARKFFSEHFIPNFVNRSKDTIFSFTGSNLGIEFVEDLIESTLVDKKFLNFKPNNLWDYYQTDEFYYIDHHQSHAAYAFLSSGFNESDILAIDGKGWNFSCIFIDKNGNITDLSSQLSIGSIWNKISQELGLGYLGAGKTMGLAAFGKYNKTIHDIILEHISSLDYQQLTDSLNEVSDIPKEDVAFTLQYVTNELVKKIVYPLKTSDNICVCGGVAYNGYMNEELTTRWTNVHVPPAVGDEGHAMGTYMHADYMLNKHVHIPSVYSGVEHSIDTNIFRYLKYQQKSFDEICVYVAHAIANGKIVGWYQGKSESGNRALGNRSILADPRNPNIKNIINTRIKLREDFRPFAPSVLEEHYKEFFLTNQPSPFMSRIMPVISNKIPGVTHVDRTARIQTVSVGDNEKFHKLISEFYKITGIPMVLNTSFNCREPIVETPRDAVNTFIKCGLDILIIDNYLIEKYND